MKGAMITICLLLTTRVAGNLITGQPQKSGNAAGSPPVTATTTAPLNPLKVALLKWYPFNATANFAVGKLPYGVAFDGSSIWVANSGDGTVTKMWASDGAILGTFSTGSTGNLSSGVVFDGANVWVSNLGGNNVTKLRASDGTNLGTFNVGSQPFWMAFDGSNIWVANSGDGTVTKLRASDGKNLGTFNTNGAIAVAFDGTYVWVSTYTSTVVRLKHDGSNAGTFTVGHNCLGIAFDGANIWVANLSDGTVTKLRASDGTVLGTFKAVGGSPYGVAFDGANIWLTSGTVVVEMRPSDGTALAYYNVGGPPTGIAFDGANIWVASVYSNIVSKV